MTNHFLFTKMYSLGPEASFTLRWRNFKMALSISNASNVFPLHQISTLKEFKNAEITLVTLELCFRKARAG